MLFENRAARPHRSRLVPLAIGVLLLVPSGAPRAQLCAPRPGVDIPGGYRERIAQDPNAFTLRRAWLGVTERARLARLAEARPTDSPGLEGVAGGRAVSSVQGTLSIPVLAGKFSNTGSDPYAPLYLQQRLFDGPNSTGTVTDYYREISSGRVTVTGRVIGNSTGGLYMVSRSDSYYEGGCNGLCGNGRVGEFLREMLDGTDPQVNFGLYDNDGPDGVPNSGDDDGFVDLVAFVQPEYGGECGGSNIWSHRWAYDGWWGQAYTTHDPSASGGYIKVNDYCLQPLRSCSGLGLIEIGVYAHEFGHAFGLPDLYDLDRTSNGVGNWCLMGTGSWGGDGETPERPAHMGAWAKEQLGWVETRVVCGNQLGASLPAVEDSALVLKVLPHGVTDTEYFLIENRVAKKFDASLPVSGLAVWHIDNDQPGNSDESHKKVDLLEADGWDHLDHATNRGDAGDLYPGSANRTTLSDFTYPNTRDYALTPTGFSLSRIGSVANPRQFDITAAECQIRVLNAVASDASCGNNDDVIDANEVLEIDVAVVNDSGGSVSGVGGTLTCLSADAVVLRNHVTYGDVAGGNPVFALDKFVVRTASGLVAGTSIPFRLNLTWNGGGATQGTFSLAGGRYVLVVEDDGGPNNSPYYMDALQALGRPAIRHDILTQGLPDISTLRAASAVVWYTGQITEGTFTAQEQALIQTYLNGGGSLFVTGQDVGLDLVQTGSASDRLFYNTCLHADFVADVANDQSLTGTPGDPIGDGLSLLLSGGDGAGNSMFSSRIAPRAGATEVFSYSAGNHGAVRWAGTHRVVYFAFNFEAISAATTRQTVLRRILDWLSPPSSGFPLVTLTRPGMGEVWDRCTPRDITWTATDNDGVRVVDLYYGTDAEFTYPHPIATGLANTGRYSWTPSGLAGNGFRIKILVRDAGGLQGVDTSDLFSVDPLAPACQPPQVRLLAPNGGEVFGTHNVVQVNWTVTGSGGGIVDIATSLDGGSNWTPLATGLDQPPYAWLTPNAVGPCLLRVRIEGEGGAQDISDAVFNIQDDDPPQVWGVRPYGGEVAIAGAALDIRATASDNIGLDSLCVSYTLDDGATWLPAGCGTLPFSWVTPDVESRTCRVRVLAWDAAGNHQQAESDSAFALVQGVTGIPEGQIPAHPVLLNGHPNPMASLGTAIGFYLPEEMLASITVYDISGRRVVDLVRGRLPGGYHEAAWDGHREDGGPAAGGVYFVVLQTAETRDVRRLVKLR